MLEQFHLWGLEKIPGYGEKDMDYFHQWGFMAGNIGVTVCGLLGATHNCSGSQYF